MAQLVRNLAKWLSAGYPQFLLGSPGMRRFWEASTRKQGITGPSKPIPSERRFFGDDLQNGQDSDEPDRDGERSLHRVRALKVWEEGFDLTRLPNGIFGFIYSPGDPDAPVFRRDGEAAFEIHKSPDGRTFLLCYVSEESASITETARKDIHLRVYPRGTPGASRLISVPLSLIARYRDYPPRDGNYLEIQVTPARRTRQARSGGVRRSASNITMSEGVPL